MVSVSDLINVINLPEDEAKSYLNAKGFKLKFISHEAGFAVDQFEILQKGKQETVTYGQRIKTVKGTVLHTLQYATNTGNYMNNLIAGAQNSGLQLDFKGADNAKNIYFYSSSQYQINFYLNFNKSYGIIEIKEKETGGS